MKYELVSLSVTLLNKVFRKEEKPTLDDSKLPKDELEAAYKAGFIKPVGTKAKTPQEVIDQYRKEASKAKSKDNSKLEEERAKEVEEIAKKKAEEAEALEAAAEEARIAEEIAAEAKAAEAKAAEEEEAKAAEAKVSNAKK